MPQTTTTTNTPRAERRPQQWWLEQVQAWQASGLSKAQYCVAHGLKPGSVYRWASRLRQPMAQALHSPASAAPRSSFVQARVQREGASAVRALTVGEVTVQFDAGLAPTALAEWVQALRTLPC